MMDGHHTYQAAKELGLEISFDVTDDPEGLDGDDLLMAYYGDRDYYDVEASDAAEDRYCNIF